MPFYLKQNDTSPVIQATCVDASGTAVNVNGSTVAFNMREYGSTTAKISLAAGSVVDGVNGIVKYEWAVGDTDEVGEFNAEFQITFSDGKVETFPNHDYIQVVITDDIA